jgi:hypothetical protein
MRLLGCNANNSCERAPFDSMTARARAFIVVVAMAPLFGCAIGPYGPLYGSDLSQRVSQELPPDDSIAALTGYVIWHTTFRPTGGGVIQAQVKGAGAVTGRALYLLQWSSIKKRLEITKIIPVDSIASVRYFNFPLQLVRRDCDVQIEQRSGDIEIVTFTHADIAANCELTRELYRHLIQAVGR